MAFKRVFVAIAIPPQIRRALSACKASVDLPGLSWVKEENLHITVLFIGDTDAEQIPVINQKLATLTTLQPFCMYCKEVFPVMRRGKRSMIWASFKESPEFVQLSTQVSLVLQHSPDHSPLPHVTLARVKSGQSVKINNAKFPSIRVYNWQVQKFGLWESVLSPQGSKYRVLHEWELNAV